MGIKKKKTYANCCSWTLSHFSKNVMSNDCKSNVSAHQSCTIEVFRFVKEITRILSRPTGILQHLEVFYILF